MKYCNWIYNEQFYGHIYVIECTGEEIYYDNLNGGNLEMFNYCPQCGRKIKKDKEIKMIEKRFIQEVSTGDVGYIIGKIGSHFKAEFKIKGLFGFRESNIGILYKEITKQEYIHTKKETIVAKKKEATKSDQEVKEAKAKLTKKSSKPKVERKSDKLGVKDAVRIALKELDVKKINTIAKKLKVDVNKYKHLSGGLYKMSVSNKINACLCEKINNNELKSKKAVLDLIK